MFLLYVDESGDAGLINSPTSYFILSAIIVHETNWNNALQDLVDFRRLLRDSKGLKLREEIHANEFINKPGDLKRIKRNDRLDILKKCMDWINSSQYLSVFSIAVNKQLHGQDIFEIAWNTLIMRFENTLEHKNFVGSSTDQDKGIILSDNTDGDKLRKLMRKMRHYNMVPNNRNLYAGGYRNIKLTHVIEDPILRDSRVSYLHQMADVIAYCVRQRYEPNQYMKKKGATSFYKRINAVIVKEVSSNNLGIVEI